MTVQPQPQPKKVLRVVEVTRYIKQLLERDQLLSLIQVQGEVSALSRTSSGYVYFTLKDATSQISCVIPRNNAASMRNEVAVLQQGSNVLIEASVSVYEQRGSYQLLVQRMRVGGEGAAKLRFQKLHAKLEAEGLFSSGRKRTLVKYPRKLVLITAPDSQAYHDVTRRLQIQWPHVTVIAAPVNVQGEHAPGQIATALDIANRLTDADVILIVRGGGSPEELEAFNDERLARAIFASRIPVVTGIGHTKDTSIADLVADVVAPTPTAAANVVVPDGEAMLRKCTEVYESIKSTMYRSLGRRRESLIRTRKDLVSLSPHNRVIVRRQRLDESWTQLGKTMTADLQIKRRTLGALQRQMEVLNPTAILARGYALLTDDETGSVIASTASAAPGRRLRAQVKDGTFQVTVNKDD